MKNIYLDNAASTAILDVAIESMTEALQLYQGNPSSTHRYGRKVKAAIEKARKEIADIFNTTPGEIFFTSGGTEANNTVLHSAIKQLGIKNIVTSPTEHPSVKKTIDHIHEYYKIPVTYLKVDSAGRIDLNELEAVLNERPGKTTLVSLMHANNETGLLHPIDKIGDLCQKTGALFHTDAVQTVGHLPIDLSDGKISFLSASAHKFNGPKGIGILYIHQDNMIEPFIRGGNQERGVRAGTENVAGILGMASALTYGHEQFQQKKNYVTTLRNYFIGLIEKELPEVKFISQKSNEECLFTILNLYFPKSENTDMLLMNLDLEGISASGGSACNSGAAKESYVLEALGWNKGGKSIRFSFSFQNNIEEIDHVIQVLKNNI